MNTLSDVREFKKTYKMVKNAYQIVKKVNQMVKKAYEMDMWYGYVTMWYDCYPIIAGFTTHTKGVAAKVMPSILIGLLSMVEAPPLSDSPLAIACWRASRWRLAIGQPDALQSKRMLCYISM